MNELSRKIDHFIRTGNGEFESLATELFAYQYEKNASYRAFCDAQRISPGTVKHWQDIPAVPVRAFKSAELATFPTARAAAMFESSRTTGQTPSRHYLKDLAFYETACVKSFTQWMLPDNAKLPFLILAPTPGEAPRSSLSWMFDTVKRKCAASGDYFVLRGRLDEPRLASSLDAIQKAEKPVALLGTTLAFLAFFDYCRAQKRAFLLPEGSRLFDTGGMKGTKRETSRPEFVDQTSLFLGIPESHCVNEYGMCEMSSQFYGKGKSTFLQGPPWVRTLAMDAVTGQPAQGQGLLRHFDLANVDSVMAIQTEDMGVMEAGGFQLLGRSPGAEVRGCSLAAESF